MNLDVYSEVLGPFQISPRSVLEAGGNAVMHTLAGQLLPVFLRRCTFKLARIDGINAREGWLGSQGVG